jgi:hypothetical protein
VRHVTAPVPDQSNVTTDRGGQTRRSGLEVNWGLLVRGGGGGVTGGRRKLCNEQLHVLFCASGKIT